MEPAVVEQRLEARMARVKLVDGEETAPSPSSSTSSRSSGLFSVKKTRPATFAPLTSTLSSLTRAAASTPPVLPRRPKVDTTLPTLPWKGETLDTSGESGYSTDNSDKESLRSQDSSAAPHPPAQAPPEGHVRLVRSPHPGAQGPRPQGHPRHHLRGVPRGLVH